MCRRHGVPTRRRTWGQMSSRQAWAAGPIGRQQGARAEGARVDARALRRRKAGPVGVAGNRRRKARLEATWRSPRKRKRVRGRTRRLQARPTRVLVLVIRRQAPHCSGQAVAARRQRAEAKRCTATLISASVLCFDNVCICTLCARCVRVSVRLCVKVSVCMHALCVCVCVCVSVCLSVYIDIYMYYI